MLEIKKNRISIDHLPELFHGYNSPLNQSLDIIQISKDKWTEFIAHLSQFNQLPVDETHTEINNLISNSNYNKDASLQAGIAKCYIAEGQFIKAIKTLGFSFTLLKNSTPDAQAFVILEMVNLLTVIGSRDNAIYLLKTGRSIARSNYLIRLYDYYNIVNQLRNGNFIKIDELINSGQYFKANNQFATLAFHYKNIGNAFGKMKDVNRESLYYKEALKICKKYNYSHIQSAIEHDVGMSYYRAGNMRKAVKKLKTTANKAESHYTKAYILGNMGFIYYQKKDYQLCSKLFKKSLDIATKNGVFHLIPSTCFYIGKSYQSISNNSLASSYFKKGYEASMEMANHKFPLKGERLMVIHEYVKSINSNVIREKEKSFPFAIDKTLEEIRGIFKNSVLKFLLDQKRSVADVVEYLKISPSSFSKIKNRYKKFEDTSTPIEVIKFFEDYPGLDWNNLNKTFEAQVFLFLNNEYKYNKRQLSNKLKVNYSRLVTKMNKLKEEEKK